MSKFYDLLLERRRELEKQKRILLRPLFEYVEALEKLHIAFYTEKYPQLGLTASAIVRMFELSLPGLFKTHLINKARELIVFGFNSAHYDHVLLLAPLAVAYRTRHPQSKSFKVIRSGSAVKRIMFRNDKVTFIDIRDLLSAGSSLGRFAASTGLREEKLRFPFSAWTSAQFLREPSLPTDANLWEDTLAQTAPSQEYVNGALEEFRRLQCTDVGMYLRHYLKSKFWPPFCSRRRRRK